MAVASEDGSVRVFGFKLEVPTPGLLAASGPTTVGGLHPQ